MYSCQPAVGLDCVMRVSLCAPVMSVPSSTKHGRRRAAAPRPGSRHSGCKPVAGTGCVCFAACLCAARPALRRCDWTRSTEPKGSSASRVLFDDMLPAVSCRRGCCSAEARAEGVVQGAAVQRCSDCSHCSSTSSVGRQGGMRWDRETGSQGAREGAAAPCHRDLVVPSRRNVNLNHTARGTQRGTRYGWTRRH